MQVRPSCDHIDQQEAQQKGSQRRDEAEEAEEIPEAELQAVQVRMQRRDASSATRKKQAISKEEDWIDLKLVNKEGIFQKMWAVSSEPIARTESADNYLQQLMPHTDENEEYIPEHHGQLSIAILKQKPAGEQVRMLILNGIIV